MAQLGTRGQSKRGWGDVPFDVGGQMRTEGVGPAHDGALAQRLGLTGRTRVIVVGCVVIALLGGIGAIRFAYGGDSLVVERAQTVADEGAGITAEEGSSGASGLDEGPETVETVVHVDGAVASPGVYRLVMDDPRVGDAVDAAGGLLADADTSMVNLAEVVADGSKVHVYHQDEVAAMLAAPTGAEASPLAAESGTGAASGLINVNVADREQLETLPGVGEATANAIIDERERNGAFASVDELTRVDGIGDKKLAKIRDFVCV